MNADESNGSNSNDQERDRPYKPGIFRVRVPGGEDLLKDFRLIEITECLFVQFDGFESSRTLKVSIRNRSTYRLVKLLSVEIILSKNLNNHPLVKLSEKCGNVTDTREIPTRGVCTLEFEVAFVSGIAFSTVVLKFHFDDGIVIRRSIQIYYRPNAPIFQRSRYDVPADLVNLVSRQRIISCSSLISKGLDEFVPSVVDNYQKHFHNLLFLEEAGMRQEIIDKYSQVEAFFGDTRYTRVDSMTVREKYKTGQYDLTVHDLYETRPSLQIGMAHSPIQ